MEALFYCRSGYEADLLAEIEHACGTKGHYGYAKFSKNTAVLSYTMPQVSIANSPNGYFEANKILPKYRDLMFARQKLIVLATCNFSTADRISEIENELTILSTQHGNIPTFSDVFVEYPDTEEGKQIAKFCKKFSVPLRNHLRKAKWLRQKSHAGLSASSTLSKNAEPYLHLLFTDSSACTLAMSFPEDRSDHPMGIYRLKMPNDAPSRSTLKLEEAIKTFFNPAQAMQLFTAGMRAVDLGACPGGWSYQLVQRKITVEAVDHGEIDTKLMQTGLVEYYSEDGFLYQPQQGNVDWLVCDMIEQPTRVSELMLDWLESGKANAAIFNLKLPMNKRHKVVKPILDKLSQQLTNRFGEIVITVKHLYHNRDEVTFLVMVNSQMISLFKSHK